jgi:hypothetical protein
MSNEMRKAQFFAMSPKSKIDVGENLLDHRGYVRKNVDKEVWPRIKEKMNAGLVARGQENNPKARADMRAEKGGNTKIGPHSYLGDTEAIFFRRKHEIQPELITKIRE